MTSEQQLREKLRKISALFHGATTAGERDAAAAAMQRVKNGLETKLKAEQLIEFKFSLPDRWQRRLFSALCRRHGGPLWPALALSPYVRIMAGRRSR